MRMAIQHNLRGFARLDVLVAGVMCLILVLLVPLLLAKPRERSVRTLCAANLAQIGKIMFVYATDNEDALPRAGGRNTVWGPVANWMTPWRIAAFGLTAVDSSGGKASISSCFYLLVKYYEAPTRLFLCRGDKGTTEFRLSDAIGQTAQHFELIDAWDFGPGSVARRSCSFSYHFPFSQYALTTSRDPNLAVAADRNPWLSSPAWPAGSFADFRPDFPPFSNSEFAAERARTGNAVAHGMDGQNVLFLDGRVTFETRAYCGVGMDNIYTLATGALDGGLVIGTTPTTGHAMPANQKDSVLVHDPRLSTDDPSLRR